MANRGFAWDDNIDPAISDNNFSNGYQTEEESTTSNDQRYPRQAYAQQDYQNSLQTGLTAFAAGRTPFQGSYAELAAQGRGPPPYPTQPAQTLPQVSNQQFPSFEDTTQGHPSLLTLSEFTTRAPVETDYHELVGWYIRPQMVNVPGIGDVFPIASPIDDPAFGNFPPSNLATPTGPPPSRPAPSRRRRNPQTSIQEATMTPFADPANIPPAAIEAFGAEGREDPGPVHKESVMKACTCYAGRKGKIPRPSNAFILYRSANSQRGKEHLEKTGNPNTGASEISRICGVWWRKMSEAEKAPWRKKEQEEKEEHERLYPEYSYDPGAVNKRKFGTVDCKCGAYEYNLEQRRLRDEREAQNPSKGKKKRGRGGPKQQPVPSMDEYEDDVADEHYGDDSDAYVPPGEKSRGKQPMKKRKTNTMTSSAAPSTSASAGPSRTRSQAMEQYFQDYPTPTQQTFQGVVNAGRASRQQTPAGPSQTTSQARDQYFQDYPTPTQQTSHEAANAGRASRQQTPPRSYATPPRQLRTQPDISYAEPANEGFEDTDMSGTDDNRGFGFDDLVQFPDDWDADRFNIDPSYNPPAFRLSRFGRRSGRAAASRSFYAR